MINLIKEEHGNEPNINDHIAIWFNKELDKYESIKELKDGE